MENNETQKFKKFIINVINGLKNKVFVIFYFLILYTISVVIVGKMKPTYVIITTIMTVSFSNQHQKLNTVSEIIYLFLFQYLMMALAFVARINIYLAITLNIIVPYFVIILKSSQYNKLGYYVYLMSFIYFQILPKNFSINNFDFNYIYLVLAGNLLFVILKYISYITKDKVDIYELEKKGLDIISSLLKEENDNNIKELDKISKDIIYNIVTTGKTDELKRITREKYLYSLFFEKYLRIDKVNYNLVNDLELKYIMDELESFFRKICVLNLENKKTVKEIYKELQNKIALVKQNPFLEKNYLPWLKILEEILYLKTTKVKQVTYDAPITHKIKSKLQDNIRYNSYTFRFATQMSITVLIGVLIANFSSINRGLWIAMTMFLLLRPTQEESKYRMKNRIIGTLIGSLIASFLFQVNINDYKIEAIIICGIIGIFIFTLTPGTIFQAIMITVYSLILTSFRIEQGEPIGPLELVLLRILYTLFSAFVVIIINTCIFPTTTKSEYKYNTAMIYNILDQYLKLISEALYRPISNYEIKDLKIRYISLSKMLLETKLNDEEKVELDYKVDKFDELVFNSERAIFNLANIKLNMKEKEMLYNFSKYSNNSIKKMKKNKAKEIKRPDIKTKSNDLNDCLISYLNNLDYLIKR